MWKFKQLARQKNPNLPKYFYRLHSIIFSFGILSPKLVPDTNLQIIEKPLDF